MKTRGERGDNGKEELQALESSSLIAGQRDGGVQKLLLRVPAVPALEIATTCFDLLQLRRKQDGGILHHKYDLKAEYEYCEYTLFGFRRVNLSTRSIT